MHFFIHCLDISIYALSENGSVTQLPPLGKNFFPVDARTCLHLSRALLGGHPSWRREGWAGSISLDLEKVFQAF